MSELEVKIQNKICEYLQKKGYFFFRLNNTPVFDQKLNNGYGAYRAQGKWSAPGLADILLVDTEKYGRAVFFEIKSEKGKQSADQRLFEHRCHTTNAEYYLVRSIEDIKKAGY